MAVSEVKSFLSNCDEIQRFVDLVCMPFVNRRDIKMPERMMNLNAIILSFLGGGCSFATTNTHVTYFFLVEVKIRNKIKQDVHVCCTLNFMCVTLILGFAE